jgi:hypothetical protein
LTPSWLTSPLSIDQVYTWYGKLDKSTMRATIIMSSNEGSVW